MKNNLGKFGEIINADKPVLVDFFATWCGPCKTMSPILEQLKSRIGDKAMIIKVDVDKSAVAASTFNVQSVPTLILFKKGEIKWRQSGVVSANELENIIAKNS